MTKNQGQSLFLQVVKAVGDKNKYDKIYSEALNKYQLAPYKISRIYLSTAKRFYANIKSKYQNGQFEVSPKLWYQNQRRMFVWFIICYQEYFNIPLQQLDDQQWKKLSKVFHSKDPIFLQFQYKNLIKNKGRPHWSEKQDQLLRKAVKNEEVGKWNEISKEIFFQSNRQVFKTPKQCRQRWLNHLDQSKRKTPWTKQQDLIMLQFVNQNGKKWAKIVPKLNNTRTQHMIKNRYNSLIANQKKSQSKQLINMLIKQLQSQLNKQQNLQKIQPQIKNEVQNNIQQKQIQKQKQKSSNNLNLFLKDHVTNELIMVNVGIGVDEPNQILKNMVSPQFISPPAGLRPTPDSTMDFLIARSFQSYQKFFLANLPNRQIIESNNNNFHSDLSQDLSKINGNQPLKYSIIQMVSEKNQKKNQDS